MPRMSWLTLVISLPGAAKTERQRIWRALRGSGAAALRDGVYLLPAGPAAAKLFDAQVHSVVSLGGTGDVMSVEAADGAQQARFRSLFDRGEDQAKLIARAQRIRDRIALDGDAEIRKQIAALRRDATILSGVDFFPGAGSAQLGQAVADTETAVATFLQRDEPHSQLGAISRSNPNEYQGRLWATRKRIWVDRVASAWLIARLIDARARFVWLDAPADCPADAIGFDFDGATFTHVGARVTFEVLLASFGFDNDAALKRLGHVVHSLDVGGAPVPEAAGLAAILTGFRARNLSDDEMLRESSVIFDALYLAFGRVDSP